MNLETAQAIIANSNERWVSKRELRRAASVVSAAYSELVASDVGLLQDEVRVLLARCEWLEAETRKDAADIAQLRFALGEATGVRA